MKKTLYFIAAITMVASSAMASKARVSALGAPPAYVDVQGIFNNPADMHYVGDFATFEMGETPTTTTLAGDTTPNAEGGFITTMSDSKFGFYMGRMTADTNKFRKAASAASFLPTENPIEFFYGSKAGDLNWAASFGYSNSEHKNATGSADDQKQHAMGVRMGVKTDEWAAYANIGLGADAKAGPTAEVKGTAQLVLGGSYNINTMKVYGKYENAGAKATSAAGATAFDDSISITTVGFLNAWKADGNLAYYGIAYKMYADKNKVSGFEIKQTQNTMPFTMGTEVLAASWLKLRGSVSQNILMSNDKIVDPTGTFTEKDNTIAHNTTTAAGAGFIWGKNTLDVVMTMGTNGGLDAATLGTNASYTYTF